MNLAGSANGWLWPGTEIANLGRIDANDLPQQGKVWSIGINVEQVFCDAGLGVSYPDDKVSSEMRMKLSLKRPIGAQSGEVNR